MWVGVGGVTTGPRDVTLMTSLKTSFLKTGSKLGMVLAAAKAIPGAGDYARKEKVF